MRHTFQLVPTITLRAVRFALAVSALAGCSTDGVGIEPREAPLFVTQVVDQTVVMEALFEGRVLVDEQGCVRLDSPEQPMVVWPRGFSLAQSGAEHRVIDASGQVLGTLGGAFKLGGGEVPTLHQGIAVDPAVRELSLATCPGSYWIVGEA